MWKQEHSGYKRAVQPQGLKLEMKDYQLQTLAWMLDHERLPHGEALDDSMNLSLSAAFVSCNACYVDVGLQM